VIYRLVRFVDTRTGQTPIAKKLLRYVFPDHWSFLLGEIALYCFVVLVATGIYLTFFFDPSLQHTVYQGSYEPLRGRVVSEAYRSVLDISFRYKAGLLIRQTHHWAADVFLVAITLHMLRVFFTGAFRKPREITYYGGVLMLMLAMFEGFAGYSLGDDLLSGMGLVIAYSIVMSLPFVGGNLALLIWHGPFPGTTDFFSRLYIAHVLLVPVAIGILLSMHLVSIVFTHHSQFRGRREREHNVVGTPLWPGYLFRTLGLAFAVSAVLFLLGGLVQINPVWQWGPFEPSQSTNGAQPDWYLGWLIGALRLMPDWEPHIGHYTLIPNAFWGGAFFPLVVFSFLLSWPLIERRLTGDHRYHHLLDRPRDAPWRTAVGVGFFTWVGMIFFAGSSDRVMVEMHISYTSQIHVYQAAVFIVPLVAAWIAKRVCEQLLRSEMHPLRGSGGGPVRRMPDGGFERVSRSPTTPRAPAPNARK
jgi:ubiquinol-cytochrome c reductase cytochrome b subunit